MTECEYQIIEIGGREFKLVPVIPTVEEKKRHRQLIAKKSRDKNRAKINAYNKEYYAKKQAEQKKIKKEKEDLAREVSELKEKLK